MNSETEEHLEQLKNRVWITKKIRMEAEERRLRLKRQLDLVLNSTTIFSLILSVIGLVPQSLSTFVTANGLAVFAIILSIVVMATSFIVTTYKLQESAGEFKESYMDLSILEQSILNVEVNDKAKISALSVEYTNILKKTLNHNDTDYLYFQINQYKSQKNDSNNGNCNISRWDFMRYFVSKYFLSLLFMIVVAGIVSVSFVAVIHA